ncbi:hypothetical protein Syun_016855 [Stephania yunnanensis]|uniref:Uncharacterized protein n=1 Tax=Stephania yunnanensis TaxID=152371 RepID=A0AAP0J842_9MAGN
MRAKFHEGARLMSLARRMRDGLDVREVGESEEEDMDLFAVMTNGVEVQADDEGLMGSTSYLLKESSLGGNEVLGEKI